MSFLSDQNQQIIKEFANPEQRALMVGDDNVETTLTGELVKKDDSMGTFRRATYLTAGAATGVVDWAINLMPDRFVGDQSQLMSGMLSTVGAGDFAKYYQDNRNAFMWAGDAAMTLFAPAAVARMVGYGVKGVEAFGLGKKTLQVGSDLIAKSPTLDKVWNSSGRLQAAQAIHGSELGRAIAAVGPQNFSQAPAYINAMKELRKAKVIDVAKEGVTSSLAVAAAFQMSGRAGDPNALLYSDGISIGELAFDIVSGGAIGAGLGALQARKLMRLAQAGQDTKNAAPVAEESIGNVLHGIDAQIKGTNSLIAASAGQGLSETGLQSSANRAQEAFTQQVANAGEFKFHGLSKSEKFNGLITPKAASALRDPELGIDLATYRTHEAGLSIDDFVSRKDGIIKDIRAKLVDPKLPPAERDLLIKQLDDVTAANYSQLTGDGKLSNTPHKSFFELDSEKNMINRIADKGGENPRYFIVGEAATKERIFISNDGLVGLKKPEHLRTDQVTGLFAAQKMWVSDMLATPGKMRFGVAEDGWKSLNHMDMEAYLEVAKRAEPQLQQQAFAALGVNSIDEAEFALFGKKIAAMQEYTATQAYKKETGGVTDWLDLERKFNLNLTNKDGSLTDVGSYVGNLLVGRVKMADEAQNLAELNGRIAHNSLLNAQLAAGNAAGQIDPNALSQQAIALAQRGFQLSGRQFDRALSYQPSIAFLSRGNRGVNDPARLHVFDQANNIAHEMHTARIAAMVEGVENGVTDPQFNLVGSVFNSFKVGGRLEGARETVKQAVAHTLEELVDAPAVAQFGRLSTLPTSHQLRHIPFAKAAQTMMEASDKQIISQIAPFMTELRGKFASTLRPGSKELAEFNDYMASMRAGWDLQDVKSLALADTSMNRQIFEQNFPGQTFKPGMTMPTSLSNKQYVGIQLSDKVKELLEAKDIVNSNYVTQWNAIARNTGHREISHRPGYIEPINLSNREVVFVQGADGRVIDYAHAATRSDAVAEAEKIAASFRDKGIVAGITTQDNIAEWYALKNEAFSKRILDYTKVVNQSGARNSRAMQNIVDDPQTAVNEMLNATTGNWLGLGRYARQIQFQQELKHLSLMNDMSVTKSALRNGEGKPSARNAYELMEDLILQRSPTNPGSLYGIVGGTVDNLFNSAVNAAVEKFHQIVAPVAKLGKADAVAMEQYATQYSNELRKMGFSNLADDFFQKVESRVAGYTVPKDVRKYANQLNMFTTQMNLTLLSTGSAFMNMAGLLTTTPAVMSALKRNVGESAASWGARSNRIADILDAEGVAQVNPTKALGAFTKRFFTGDKELREAFKEAKELGHIGSSGDYHQLMEDVFADTSINRGAALAKKSSEWLGKIATMSEDASRGLMYGLGWTIAREAGASKEAARTVGAQFADAAIANYARFNKPEIYRSSVGSIFGLFQTYTANYWSRLLTGLENRDTKTLGVQAMAQGLFFGARTIPGFSQLSDAYSYVGDDGDFEDQIAKRLGRDAAQVVNNGLLPNVTKLFGGDGIAMSGRAQPSLPVPNESIAQTPAVQMFSNIGQMGQKIYNSLAAGGSSPDRILEIMGAHFPQRELARLAEIYQGYSVDRSGRVIDDETRTASHIMASALGMRTLAEDELRRNSYKMRQDMKENREAFAELGRNLKTRIRNNNITEDDLGNFYEEYVRSGRDPEKFKTWLKTTLVNDDVNGEGRIIREIGQNEKFKEMGRLRFAMAGE